jgi:hypothetical protein
MAKTSTVVWSLIGTVIAVLGILGLIYGPGMYRQGKALVGPIVDIAQSEERLTEMNNEIPFDEPSDGAVNNDRFTVFLDIRRDFLPRYLEWQAIERKLEQGEPEDWETGMEVLKAIQGVMTMQIETLRKHGMSPAEFIWIEDSTYVNWAEHVTDVIDGSIVSEKLRETTVSDMEALADLERRYGSSRATREFAAVLDARLESLDNPGAPMVEGVPEANSTLFWDHRDEIVELDLARYSELHDIIRGNNNVNINIDSQADED